MQFSIRERWGRRGRRPTLSLVASSQNTRARENECPRDREKIASISYLEWLRLHPTVMNIIMRACGASLLD